MPSGSSTKILYALLLHPYILHAPPISFHWIWTSEYLRFGEEYTSLSSSLCSLLRSPLTSSFLGPNFLLITLFSDTLSLRSSINVRDQVSHPYKTTGKIMALYILIYLSSDGKLTNQYITRTYSEFSPLGSSYNKNTDKHKSSSIVAGLRVVIFFAKSSSVCRCGAARSVCDNLIAK